MLLSFCFYNIYIQYFLDVHIQFYVLFYDTYNVYFIHLNCILCGLVTLVIDTLLAAKIGVKYSSSSTTPEIHQ